MCEGYLVALSASFYEPRIVLAAAFMTAGVVIGLTIYAWTTKTDFTVLGGMCWILSFAFTGFMIFVVIFRSHYLTMVYCFIGVIVFGIYLIFDT